jgi:outer membrane lipoprotein carrier protein
MKGLISAVTAFFLSQSMTPTPALIKKQTTAPVKVVASLGADEVVKKLQKFYDDTSDFSSDFEQKYTYKAYGRSQTSKGKVFFKKAGKMSWNYTKPTTKYFITDGSDFWVYEPEEKQAYKAKLEESQIPVALTFLSGKGKLLDEFTAKLLTGDPRALTPTDYVVELTPKKGETDYKKVVMIVNSADFSLAKIFVYDPTDNENQITFKKTKVNKGIPDTQFKFSPPADVKIVDPPTSEEPTSEPTK